jgi:hypothetical protein
MLRLKCRLTVFIFVSSIERAILISGRRLVMFALYDSFDYDWRDIPLGVDSVHVQRCYCSYGIDRPALEPAFEILKRLSRLLVSSDTKQRSSRRLKREQPGSDHEMTLRQLPCRPSSLTLLRG